MKNAISIVILLAIGFSACDRSMVYDQYKNMPEEQWHVDSLKTFEFTIDDSLAIYNMYINVRNVGNYPFSNLIIFVETQLPGNRILKDTLDCVLADKKGEWLGSGFGSLWTSKVPYKYHVRFPRKGIYVVDIQHGMRKEVLEGITDIGVRIEKAN
ncbi:MAG: gliding motility lipoprotein GldH [Salinivirgaceae bacterium]|jgi:gliding motility-associated lipoprotein GldH